MYMYFAQRPIFEHFVSGVGNLPSFTCMYWYIMLKLYSYTLVFFFCDGECDTISNVLLDTLWLGFY